MRTLLAELLADLTAGRWAAACWDFGTGLAQRLDAEALAGVWARLTAMFGRLEELGEPAVSRAADRTLAEIQLFFEAADRTARISHHRTGKVAGLLFLPPGHL